MLIDAETGCAKTPKEQNGEMIIDGQPSLFVAGVATSRRPVAFTGRKS